MLLNFSAPKMHNLQAVACVNVSVPYIPSDEINTSSASANICKNLLLKLIKNQRIKNYNKYLVWPFSSSFSTTLCTFVVLQQISLQSLKIEIGRLRNDTIQEAVSKGHMQTNYNLNWLFKNSLQDKITTVKSIEQHLTRPIINIFNVQKLAR